MRTAIDIGDALLRAARSRATRDRKSLDAVVELALRDFLSRQDRAGTKGPPIPIFQGQGMQPGADLADNAALEDLLNTEP